MLTADVIFINNLPFVVIFWQGIQLIKEEFKPTCTVTWLASYVKEIITLYARAGFVVQTILMDMESTKWSQSYQK